MQVLDRIFDRQDVHAVLAVDQVDDAGQRGRFAGSRDPANEDESLLVLDDALELLLRLKGVTFEYKDLSSRFALPGRQIGLIAQGKLLAQGTPEEISERTGKDSLEDAFLVIAEELGVHEEGVDLDISVEEFDRNGKDDEEDENDEGGDDE